MSKKMDRIEVPKPRQRLLSLQEMRDCDIFGIGNPVVDVVAVVDETFLETHNLPKNGTILADVQNDSLFDDIMNNYDIEYSAGGSIQNALRFCQWVIGHNNSVANFIGSVGDDYFGNILAQKVKTDGLNAKYQRQEQDPKRKDRTTGLSAILFSNGGKNKTVCTNLGASKLLDMNFLKSNFWYCERSKIIVLSGHLIAVSSEIVMHLATYAHEWGKDFIFNMGASYVVKKYTNVLNEVFQYIDFLFCNDDEAIAYATMKGYHTKELKQVAKLMADEPKALYNNPRIPNTYKSGRIVIVTQKEKPILLAQTKSKDVKEIPVKTVNKEEIKDTTGAGDAFLGGFLAMYTDGRDIEFCISCGIYCASECIKLTSCTLPKVMSFES